MIGNCLKKFNITGKNEPNKFKKPKDSTINPVKGLLKKTSNIPPKKDIVPLNFCGLEKNINVFCKPINKVTPQRNNI